MKPYIRSLEIFMKQIWQDSMLIVICATPLVEAALFGYGIPAIENLLCAVLGRTSVLAEYYLLFDLVLAIITPYIFTFISAMVMLTEMDENLAAYMAVTPLRKKGYIISRLGFPTVIALVVSILLMSFFSLSPWTFNNILLVSLLASLISIPVAMLIVTFSHNRVEGMALAKMAGLILVGLPAPFFLRTGLQYLFSWLPSLWMAKAFVDASYWSVIPSVLVSCIWIWALYRRFERKIL